jgi:hypothetical protein
VKLKLDENIPESAAVRLAALGYDVHTVLGESLGGLSDADVWRAAQEESRLLVTHDLDFADQRRLRPVRTQAFSFFACRMTSSGGPLTIWSRGSLRQRRAPGSVASSSRHRPRSASAVRVRADV